jgi:hypothetical protein
VGVVWLSKTLKGGTVLWIDLTKFISILNYRSPRTDMSRTPPRGRRTLYIKEPFEQVVKSYSEHLLYIWARDSIINKTKKGTFHLMKFTRYAEHSVRSVILPSLFMSNGFCLSAKCLEYEGPFCAFRTGHDKDPRVWDEDCAVHRQNVSVASPHPRDWLPVHLVHLVNNNNLKYI